MRIERYPWELTKEEAAELKNWRVKDTGKQFECQRRGLLFWSTQRAATTTFGSHIMAADTVEGAWEAIKWRIHYKLAEKDRLAARKLCEAERAKTAGNIYTTPED